MELSAPIHHLKREAKVLSREERIPLHKALDRIARKEGFSSWGLLITKVPTTPPASKLYSCLKPGDLVLVGARPGQGKTLMSLELAAEAMKSGNRSVFFTLDYSERDFLDRIHAIGLELAHFDGLFEFDGSDAISADYMMERLASAAPGTLIVVDYLQLLDQRGENSELKTQIHALSSFAQLRGLIAVFISQIDRSYDPSKKPFPDLRDVRLPNPVDLTLFKKTCFLNNGKVRYQEAS